MPRPIRAGSGHQPERALIWRVKYQIGAAGEGALVDPHGDWQTLLNGLGRTIERIWLCLDRGTGDLADALSTGVLPSLIRLNLTLEAHPFDLSIAVLPSLRELTVQGGGVVLPDHLFPHLTDLDVSPFRGQHAQTIIAAAREGRLSRLEALRLGRTGLDVPDAMRLADQLEHMPKLQVLSGVVGALSIPQWQSIRDRHPHVTLR
jgi:hypothetical protein